MTPNNLSKERLEALADALTDEYGATAVELRLAISELLRLREANEQAQDKIDGLESDLRSAVGVVFNRGGYEWCRLNYPDWHREFARSARNGGSENG